MPFTPQEISDKEFVVAMRGYDRTEVQAFLRSVAADIAQLRAEADAARARAEAATKEGSDGDAFGRLGESIAAMLRQAKETSTASLQAAEAEAETTKNEARERAEDWLRLARERADIIISNAQADADRRTDQAIERSETMLEEARTRSEALIANAEARAEQMLTAARTETARLEAASDDLRQRLTLAHGILGDLIGHMPEESVVGPLPTELEGFAPGIEEADEADTVDGVDVQPIVTDTAELITVDLTSGVTNGTTAYAEPVTDAAPEHADVEPVQEHLAVLEG